MDKEVDWPWQYNFPPFFTLQPNLDTRSKQIEAWCSLVLSYHRGRKQYNLDVNESQISPLFFNKKIDRKLSRDGIETILDELRRKGNVEWLDKTRKQCLVMWRTPEEWGKLIYNWTIIMEIPDLCYDLKSPPYAPVFYVKNIKMFIHPQGINSNGMTNTVCTFFELVNGDDTSSEEFHGLDTPILMRALQSLESQRKAEIIGEDGVKFFQ